MSLRSVLVPFLFLFTFSWNSAFAQTVTKTQLRNKIQRLITDSKAKVGIGIMGLDFKDSLTINGTDRFAMQSVYKFPLALFVLSKVDKGKLSLSQKIHIRKQSLDTATWGPLVKDFPNQDINMSIADLLLYSVSKSDNNACDILFRLAGGTKAVNNYIHSLSVKGIAIAATEGEMKRGWNTRQSSKVQNTNWCTPLAMLQLLRGFYDGRYLSKESNDYLMKIMTESANSPSRIKGQLPANAVVAHKTGTSNTNDAGITSVTNDVGILILPNGRHIALVVYVSNSAADLAGREGLIASIAKLAWDYYSVP